MLACAIAVATAVASVLGPPACEHCRHGGRQAGRQSSTRVDKQAGKSDRLTTANGDTMSEPAKYRKQESSGGWFAKRAAQMQRKAQAERSAKEKLGSNAQMHKN